MTDEPKKELPSITQLMEDATNLGFEKGYNKCLLDLSNTIMAKYESGPKPEDYPFPDNIEPRRSKA